MNRQRDVADALQRAVAVFTRRPDMGLHEDACARATWQGSTHFSNHHAMGTRMDTDMPRELGGSGDHPSPGWLFRAGIAACCGTAITMVAASEDIVLDALEVVVGSHSDTRGLLGMRDATGRPIHPGPAEMRMDIRIAAAHADAERLRALVDEGLRRSPMHAALISPPLLSVSITDGATGTA